MRASVVFWVENYFYTPNFFQKLLSFSLLPFSWLYCFVMWLRYKFAIEKNFGIDIVSVGNLTVGGSGKTPLVTALAKDKKDVAIILRGYGRHSKGLVVVKDKNTVLCDVMISGDEAMIYAQKLPFAVVIVAEDRTLGIEKAKEMGVEKIFLDDAYSKHTIKKKDILIDVPTQNKACLPSGAFRERLWNGKNVLVVRDGIDFFRSVTVKNATPRMALVTAIARPQRLDTFLPDVISKHYFEDHHSFTKEELLKIMDEDGATSLLVTYKDYVKMDSFGIELSLLDLEVKVSSKITEFIA